ncbi:MAG: alanine--tRNA ligase, partial [Bacteroidia bacterium]|nr:alanine--tRNA ligase [Bacteroidia bacterium]
MTSSEIRQKFLEFFKSKEHLIVPSAPIVIKNDPTLMFTNAGMNQFKDAFLGQGRPAHPRIADTQKCLRVSGKHNDLEEVGVDTYHHTMFEMLGNWSFGDYFKKEAIEWAFELLTGVYKINQEQLYATVFEGDKADNLAFDQEAYDYWLKYVPKEKIIAGRKKDNFWEMGDTGPCGPCSEVHVDLRSEEERKKTSGRELVNTGHPRVIEIWNLVFMEFNRKADGSLEKLPARNVDTGMGFERLCMALQGKQSSYDTDVFQPIIKEIEKISGKKYLSSSLNHVQEQINIAMRVAADHIRAITFTVADGQLPSNTGAGYVIRRILRRAVRYGYQSLEIKEPFLHQLVDRLIKEMGDEFPEIVNQENLIKKVIQEEEVAFLRTLDQGLKKIEALCMESQKSNKKIIEGEQVFELYDTYGFPADLTALIARGYDLKIDEQGFNVALEGQRSRSRAATAVDKEDWTILKDARTIFSGYEQIEDNVRITRYRKIKTKGKDQFQIAFDRTPFYAESGGQVGDTGLLEGQDGEIIEIKDTQKENN